MISKLSHEPLCTENLNLKLPSIYLLSTMVRFGCMNDTRNISENFTLKLPLIYLLSTTVRFGCMNDTHNISSLASSSSACKISLKISIQNCDSLCSFRNGRVVYSVSSLQLLASQGKSRKTQHHQEWNTSQHPAIPRRRGTG